MVTLTNPGIPVHAVPGELQSGGQRTFGIQNIAGNNT
jgi:hypothetical protein